MLKTLLTILFFYSTGNIGVNATNVSITVTSNNINFNNLKTIISLFRSSQIMCRTANYNINVIPYNYTAPYANPVGTNDFKDINFVFGPIQYFNSKFFGFNANASISSISSKLINYHILHSFMNLNQRFELMLKMVNDVVANDKNKSVVFVVSGSISDPMKPWQSFNPMPILSIFEGLVNVQKYYKNGDGNSVCSGILASKSVTVAMDLGTSETLDVLNNCNDKSLLHWRMRWLVFFSSMSFNPNMFANLPLRPNFTIFDFPYKSDFSDQVIQTNLDEQSIVLSDIAYSVMRLMNYYDCNEAKPTFTARTGKFVFSDPVLQRADWNLNIYRYEGKINQVGTVSISNGIITNSPLIIPNLIMNKENLLKEMQAKPFRVAAMIEAPFAYYDSSKNLTGYSVEMIRTILSQLNVSYIITPYNLSSGILINNKLNGMLGMLQNGQADIVIGPITQNPIFKSYVDFTSPFQTYKIAILYKYNQTNPFLEFFDFINAFHFSVWILIITSCVVYAVALTLVNMISPNEVVFGFIYSFLFTVGSMVQGVTTGLPDKISGRILVVFWWIFNIAILLAYVANYGAILTNYRFQPEIQQLSDLSLQTLYSYGTVINSSVDYYLQTSSSADIQNINQEIRSRYLPLMASSLSAAFDQVNNSAFAFIYADIAMQNYSTNPCMNLTTGEDQFNYSFALPLNSEFTSIINDQMFALSSNYTNSLQKYLISNPGQLCQSSIWLDLVTSTLGYDTGVNPSNAFNIDRTGGIFFVMIVGIILALFAAFIEFIIRKCGKTRRKK